MGPALRAVIEMNPEAPAIAAELDAERTAGRLRGPLHGIPILVKDNIDTADRMKTTAGSLALLGTRPAEDATVARRLREAGAVLLGKTNMSEWANIRSRRSSSGWSARGRQCRNPYVLSHNPCGSSSGSAVAVSANLCMAALGTETDGSIVCPSHINGIVGVKPTVGLVSRAGVVPIAHSQDTVGPHARTVRDAAILLSVLAGSDPRDPATGTGPGARVDYTRSLDAGALKGARIGVARKAFFGYSAHADRVIEQAIATMSRLGAVIVDPADVPTIETMNASDGELTVLLYELKADLNAYLATRRAEPGQGPAIRTLEEIIAFNEAHAAEEMPYFGQDLFLDAQAKGPLSDSGYLAALATNRRLAREEGLDAILAAHELDALIAPTGSPAWPTDPVNGDHFTGASSSPAAMAGYPLVTVPAGNAFGLPIGLTFMGRARSEETLLCLAYAFEQAAGGREIPMMRPTLDLS
jgi:amidase